MLLVSFVALSAAAPAGTVNPAGPILYYDSFEKPMPHWNAGQNTSEKGSRPQASSRKLDVASWDKSKKTVWTQLKVAQMGLKLTGALAERLFVGFQLLCDDVKDVHIGLNDGHDFTLADVKADQWTPVVCCLHRCLKNKKHPAPDFQIKELTITVVSKSGKPPAACIDDFIFTAGTTPEAAWGTAMAVEGDRLKRVADPAKVGFRFTDDMETALEAALRKCPARPPPNTMVMVCFTKHAKALADAVKEANQRKTVTAAQPPEGLKPGSVNDLRLFLPSMLSKAGGEMILIAPAPRAMMGANPADAALIVKRCLAQGALPIWVLPVLPEKAKEDDAKKLAGANASLAKEVHKLGAPTVDAKFALKDAGQVWDGDELNAAGYQALAKVVAEAMAHVDRYVRSR